jgi:amidase
MADELWRLGAGDLAAKIRKREVTSLEVVEAHLDRIERVNAKLNAVTVALVDSARAAAAAADEHIVAGEPVGPLHGVPFSVKENIDLTGSATTQGLVAMEGAMPSEDAPQVAQLKQAGAIPISRTNLPDFGLRWHTDNALRGATVNPWDAGRTPGGSSGGEAVSLATGMSPFGLGNDLGGSLRVPAQFCGIASIRPTLGRVPYATSFEPKDAPISIQLMAVEGPMARHVSDVRLALENMSGPDPRDPWWVPAPLTGPAALRRVAVWHGGDDADVDAGVDAAAGALADAGYEIVDVDVPLVSEAMILWRDLVMSDARGLFDLLGSMFGPGAHQFLDDALGLAPPLDAAAYSTALLGRQNVARTWSEFQASTPLVLGPVCTVQPFLVGRDLDGPDVVAEILETMRLVVLANLLGLPAAVVPVGVANGLPQGVEIIGPRYREDLCLDAAEAVEQRLGTITPIDPVG